MSWENVDEYARHYAIVINSPPNAWGQHISPLFGQSHFIIIAAKKKFPAEVVYRAVDKAMREHRKI